jgi:hypothetical protein
MMKGCGYLRDAAGEIPLGINSGSVIGINGIYSWFMVSYILYMKFSPWL